MAKIIGSFLDTKISQLIENRFYSNPDKLTLSLKISVNSRISVEEIAEIRKNSTGGKFLQK